MDKNGKIDSYEFICAMAMLSHSTLAVKKFILNNRNRKKLSSSLHCMTSTVANSFPEMNWSS